MGSLTSTPKVPQQQRAQTQIIQTPAAQTPQSQETPSEIAARKQDEQSKARIKSLLSRGRGRFGTIATGLQGFLREIDQGNARKTLLGE